MPRSPSMRSSYRRTIIILATYAIGLAIAIRAAIDDAKTHLLRNVYTGSIAAIAAFGFTLDAIVGWKHLRFIDLALGVVVFAGPWFVSYLISPASIGFGDVKLSAGLGLYLGWLGSTTALRALLVATLLGAAIAVLALVRKRAADPFPFGPSLVVGAVAAIAIAASAR